MTIREIAESHWANPDAIRIVLAGLADQSGMRDTGDALVSAVARSFMALLAPEWGIDETTTAKLSAIAAEIAAWSRFDAEKQEAKQGHQP